MSVGCKTKIRNVWKHCTGAVYVVGCHKRKKKVRELSVSPFILNFPFVPYYFTFRSFHPKSLVWRGRRHLFDHLDHPLRVSLQHPILLLILRRRRPNPGTRFRIFNGLHFSNFQLRCFRKFDLRVDSFGCRFMHK